MLEKPSKTLAGGPNRPGGAGIKIPQTEISARNDTVKNADFATFLNLQGLQYRHQYPHFCRTPTCPT